MTLHGRVKKGGALRTLVMEPFDIGMHATDAGVAALQSRFTNWLRGLSSPARFVTWLMPATLDDKIASLSCAAHAVTTENAVRGDLVQEYRRHYERLQDSAAYQRSLCGMALWTDENPRALTKTMTGSLEAATYEGQWPPLLEGRYRVKGAPFGHLAPVGRLGGVSSGRCSPVTNSFRQSRTSSNRRNCCCRSTSRSHWRLTFRIPMTGWKGLRRWR